MAIDTDLIRGLVDGLDREERPSESPRLRIADPKAVKSLVDGLTSTKGSARAGSRLSGDEYSWSYDDDEVKNKFGQDQCGVYVRKVLNDKFGWDAKSIHSIKDKRYGDKIKIDKDAIDSGTVVHLKNVGSGQHWALVYKDNDGTLRLNELVTNPESKAFSVNQKRKLLDPKIFSRIDGAWKPKGIKQPEKPVEIADAPPLPQPGDYDAQQFAQLTDVLSVGTKKLTNELNAAHASEKSPLPQPGDGDRARAEKITGRLVPVAPKVVQTPTEAAMSAAAGPIPATAAMTDAERLGADRVVELQRIGNEAFSQDANTRRQFPLRMQSLSPEEQAYVAEYVRESGRHTDPGIAELVSGVAQGIGTVAGWIGEGAAMMLEDMNFDIPHPLDPRKSLIREASGNLKEWASKTAESAGGLTPYFVPGLAGPLFAAQAPAMLVADPNTGELGGIAYAKTVVDRFADPVEAAKNGELPNMAFDLLVGWHFGSKLVPGVRRSMARGSYDRAVQLVKQGKIDEAVGKFENAVKRIPDEDLRKNAAEAWGEGVKPEMIDVKGTRSSLVRKFRERAEAYAKAQSEPAKPGLPEPPREKVVIKPEEPAPKQGVVEPTPRAVEPAPQESPVVPKETIAQESPVVEPRPVVEPAPVEPQQAVVAPIEPEAGIEPTVQETAPESTPTRWRGSSGIVQVRGDSVEVRFTAKTDQQTKANLKQAGFAWDNSRKGYSARNSPDSLRVAQESAGVEVAPQEAVPGQSSAPVEATSSTLETPPDRAWRRDAPEFGGEDALANELARLNQKRAQMAAENADSAILDMMDDSIRATEQEIRSSEPEYAESIIEQARGQAGRLSEDVATEQSGPAAPEELNAKLPAMRERIFDLVADRLALLRSRQTGAWEQTESMRKQIEATAREYDRAYWAVKNAGLDPQAEPVIFKSAGLPILKQEIIETGGRAKLGGLPVSNRSQRYRISVYPNVYSEGNVWAIEKEEHYPGDNNSVVRRWVGLKGNAVEGLSKYILDKANQMATSEPVAQEQPGLFGDQKPDVVTPVTPPAEPSVRTTTDLRGNPIEEQFIRLATPKELKQLQGKRSSDVYNSIPEKPGWEVVYKPYGEEGRGFYYVRETPTPALKPEAPPAKQPWEMTREEWLANSPKPSRGTEPPSVENMVRFLERPDGEPGISTERVYVPRFGTDLDDAAMIVYRNEQGKPVGLMEIHNATADSPGILNVAVEPNARRQGVGTQLYDAAADAGYDVLSFANESGYTEDGAALMHKWAVGRAIRQGKPVPPEVLADYPDLAAKYGEPAGAEPVTPAIGVGYSWESPQGTRTITGQPLVNGERRWVVRTKGQKDDHLFGLDQIEAEVARDKANLEYQSRAQAQRDAESQRQAQETAEREDIDGFADDQSDLQRRRIVSTLNKVIRYEGKEMTRKEWVRTLVDAGGRVANTKDGRRIELADDMFIGEGDLTKTGMDYAEYLISRAVANPEAAAVEEQVADLQRRADNVQARLEEMKQEMKPAEPSGVPVVTHGAEEMVPMSEIDFEPERFQYKEDNPPGSAPFNAQWADAIDVWRDPADGRLKVINGHKRYAWALRDGEPEIKAREVFGITGERAAMIYGALKNITQGTGTATDAARLFRETGLGAKDLLDHGIDLKSGIARTGMGLSKLNETLFNDVATGRLSEKRGAIIGEMVPNAGDQALLWAQMKQQEQKGKPLSDVQLTELINEVRMGDVRSGDQAGFGFIDENTIARADLAAYILSELKQDKRAFTAAAKQKARLERGGNQIDAETSRRIATEAAQVGELFSKLRQQSGPVSDIMNDGARRLTNGEEPATVRPDVYRRITETLSEAVARGEVGSLVGSGSRPGEGEAAVEPGKAGSTEPELRQPKAKPKQATLDVDTPDDFQLVSKDGLTSTMGQRTDEAAKLRQSKGSGAGGTQGMSTTVRRPNATATAPPSAPGDQAGPPPSPRDIVKGLVDATNQPHRQGRFRQLYAGIYKQITGVSRAKGSMYDVTTATHEIGHGLDERFKWSSSRSAPYASELERFGDPDDLGEHSSWTESKNLTYKRGEGVAEVIRQYIQDPATVRRYAPEFLSELQRRLGEVGLMDAIETARNDWARWVNATPWEQMTALTDYAGYIAKDAQPKNWHGFRTEVVDDLYPVRKHVEQMAKAKGREPKPSRDAYKLFRVSRGFAGMAEQLLEHGVEGETRALREVFDLIGHDQETHRQFQDYARARRLAAYGEAGRSTSQFSKEELRQIIDHYDSPEFQQAFDVTQEWFDYLLRLRVEAGVVSREAAAKMRETGDYIPMDRVMEAGVGESRVERQGTGQLANQKGDIRGYKGSDRPFRPWMEVAIEDAYKVSRMVMTSRGMKALIADAESSPGGGRILEKVAAPVEVTNLLDALATARAQRDRIAKEDALSEVLEEYPEELMELVLVKKRFHLSNGEVADKIIFDMQDGKPVFYQVGDDALHEALVGLNKSGRSALLNILAMPAQALRTGVTLDPGFLLWSNLIRDSVHAYVVSEDLFVPVVDTLGGGVQAVAGSRIRDVWQLSGGDMAGTGALDRAEVRKLAKDIGKPAVKLKNVVDAKDAPRVVVSSLRRARDASENSTRIKTFEKAYKRGLETEGWTEADARVEAAYQSRDLMDFAMKGRKVAEATRLIAFSRAAISGVAKFGRTWAQNPTRTALRLLPLVIGTALIYEMNRDDDEYWQLSQKERDRYWHIKPPGMSDFIRIPKPHEWGVICTLFERSLRLLQERDPHALDGLWDAVTSTFVPPTSPQIVSVGVGLAANRDAYWDSPIVSPWMAENIRPDAQYSPTTSPVAKVLGKWFGASPKKIEWAVGQLGGATGDNALTMLDWMTAPLTRETPERSVKMPWSRITTRTVPYTNTTDILEEVFDQVKRDYFTAKKSENQESAASDYGYKSFSLLESQYKDFKETLSGNDSKRNPVEGIFDMRSSFYEAQTETEKRAIRKRIDREAKAALNRWGYNYKTPAQ